MASDAPREVDVAPAAAPPSSGEVRGLDAGAEPEVVDVLSEAFFDYPVMRFVIGPGRPDYESGLRELVGLFVSARVLRGEALLGVAGATGLVGAAIVSRPDGGPAPEAFRTLAAEVWEDLGGPARARYDAFASACATFRVDEPHLHLNMIGVRRGMRRTGLGRRLIEHVHEMSLRDERSVGVTLTTEDPDNVPMYRHLGYEIIGHSTVAPDLRTWGFFRPD
jgi:GNAT superfamily N-acetyltransferase